MDNNESVTLSSPTDLLYELRHCLDMSIFLSISSFSWSLIRGHARSSDFFMPNFALCALKSEAAVAF